MSATVAERWRFGCTLPGELDGGGGDGVAKYDRAFGRHC